MIKIRMIKTIFDFLGSTSLTWILIYALVALAFVHTRFQSRVYYQLYNLAQWEYNPNEI